MSVSYTHSILIANKTAFDDRDVLAASLAELSSDAGPHEAVGLGVSTSLRVPSTTCQPRPRRPPASLSVRTSLSVQLRCLEQRARNASARLSGAHRAQTGLDRRHTMPVELDAHAASSQATSLCIGDIMNTIASFRAHSRGAADGVLRAVSAISQASEAAAIANSHIREVDSAGECRPLRRRSRKRTKPFTSLASFFADGEAHEPHCGLSPPPPRLLAQRCSRPSAADRRLRRAPVRQATRVARAADRPLVLRGRAPTAHAAVRARPPPCTPVERARRRAPRTARAPPRTQRVPQHEAPPDNNLTRTTIRGRLDATEYLPAASCEIRDLAMRHASSPSSSLR